MTRILSLACGLALLAPVTALAQPPQGRGGDGRDLQAEVERLRAELRALEARLAARERGPDGPKGPPQGGRGDAPAKRDGDRKDGPRADDRGPGPREVAPMPRAKGDDRGPGPKGDGPPFGRGFGPPAFGGGGFGGPGGFGKGEFGGMPGGGPKGPPFGGGFGGPGGFGRGPGGPAANPADLERRLDRIIDELERLRDDIHRNSGGPRR